MKKLSSILFHRAVLVAVSILLQLAVLVVIMLKFVEYSVPLHLCAVALSLMAVLWVVNGRSNAGFKIAWIILILAMPVMGGTLYLLFGGGRLMPGTRRGLRRMEENMEQTLRRDFSTGAMEAQAGTAAANQARYLEKYAHCPVYPDTKTDFYPLGDDAFQPMLEA